MIGGLAGGASLVGDRVVRGEGRWVATKEECEALAAPLARIGARHAPMGTGETNDVIDAIEAAVVVAGYTLERTLPSRPPEEAEGPTS